MKFAAPDVRWLPRYGHSSEIRHSREDDAVVECGSSGYRLAESKSCAAARWDARASAACPSDSAFRPVAEGAKKTKALFFASLCVLAPLREIVCSLSPSMSYDARAHRRACSMADKLRSRSSRTNCPAKSFNRFSIFSATISSVRLWKLLRQRPIVKTSFLPASCAACLGTGLECRCTPFLKSMAFTCGTAWPIWNTTGRPATPFLEILLHDCDC